MAGKNKLGRPEKSAQDLLRDLNTMTATLDEDGWAHVEREANCYRRLMRSKAARKKKGFPFTELEERQMAAVKCHSSK